MIVRKAYKMAQMMKINVLGVVKTTAIWYARTAENIFLYSVRVILMR